MNCYMEIKNTGAPVALDYLDLIKGCYEGDVYLCSSSTGWAQVNGRNSISWTKKFELDVWYVDHISFWLDIKIIFLTIKKVFIREGINMEGSATTEPFNGHN